MSIRFRSEFDAATANPRPNSRSHFPMSMAHKIGNYNVLAKIGEGATFGERALLKSEPRFAGVRATSALRTMCITKELFEHALGASLHDLIEDKY